MALEIELLARPEFRLDMSQVRAESWRSEEGLLGSSICVGNRPTQFGELFRVKRTGDAALEIWQGDLCTIDGIGANNDGRTIQVYGSVGNRIGDAMAAGKITIAGNAGDDLGRSLGGGEIEVKGDCGDRVGAAGPGQHSGMRGGLIVVAGNCGQFLGEGMRRGIIAVAVSAAPGAGNQMLGGTIVAGKLIEPFGIGMRRGTIICREFGQSPIQFRTSSNNEITMPGLLFRLLRGRLPTDSFGFLASKKWKLWAGDFLHGAKGELLAASDQ